MRINITHFHPDPTGNNSGEEYSMVEEVTDLCVILTCVKCNTQIFIKYEEEKCDG